METMTQSMTKTIWIVVLGTDEDNMLPVRLIPGDTVADVKKRLPQLRDYAFFRSHNSLPCKETKDLFPSLRDGSILYCSTYQDVGGGVLAGIRDRFLLKRLGVNAGVPSTKGPALVPEVVSHQPVSASGAQDLEWADGPAPARPALKPLNVCSG
ncbi:MAG: hypothetical protein KJ621_05445, partial [Proteobacteria bacterium]|nr:hypothetical protein [Pseudomonadota bacterium]